MSTPQDPLTLADWRRAVAEIYATVRDHPTGPAAWDEYRVRRDFLFKAHPQSPLAERQKTEFTTLPYFPYDSAYRVSGEMDTDIRRETFQIDLPAEGVFAYTRVAKIHFEIQGVKTSVSIFWIEGYGGGLFLPFKDLTNGRTTYGGGRYLYDTIKGADLNGKPGEFILDFNYAYNPSCAYNDQWVCPLSPAENQLPLEVKAGERNFRKGSPPIALSYPF